jgi:hypothetical protein
MKQDFAKGRRRSYLRLKGRETVGYSSSEVRSHPHAMFQIVPNGDPVVNMQCYKNPPVHWIHLASLKYRAFQKSKSSATPNGRAALSEPELPLIRSFRKCSEIL